MMISCVDWRQMNSWWVVANSVGKYSQLPIKFATIYLRFFF